MPTNVRDLLSRAVVEVEADPHLGQRIVARVQRRRTRLFRLGVALASVVLVAVAAVLVIAPWRSDEDVLTPAASPTPTGPDENALLDGPVGPKQYAHDPPLRIEGRAYAIGPARYRDGRPATRIVFEVDPASEHLPTGTNAYSVCTALWTPGTQVRSATVESCPSGSAGNGPTPAVLEGEFNTDGGNTAVYGPGALVTVLRKDVVRADVKLALTTDLSATATPQGGAPPVRRRLPVRIYGVGDPRMPYLIGVFDPVPAGYSTVGTDAYDAAGRQVVENSGSSGHIYLHGYYCGPDPKDGKTHLACPK